MGSERITLLSVYNITSKKKKEKKNTSFINNSNNTMHLLKQLLDILRVNQTLSTLVLLTNYEVFFTANLQIKFNDYYGIFAHQPTSSIPQIDSSHWNTTFILGVTSRFN